MPSFSTAKVRDMFDDMMDICEQMVTKWERCVLPFHPSRISNLGSLWVESRDDLTCGFPGWL